MNSNSHVSMKSGLASERDFISALSPPRENWCIVVKVVRLWFIPDRRNDIIPYSMEMVVMDEQGDKIQVTAKKCLMYNFPDVFKEGSVYQIMNFRFIANTGDYKAARHEYRLSLHYGTKCLMVDAGNVPLSPYSFISFPEINPNLETEYLVDAIGYLTHEGTEKEYVWKCATSKFRTIEIDCEGHKMKCTLHGQYVDELNAHLASSSEAQETPVVIIQFAKLNVYRGEVSLKNVMHITKLKFNPSCVEAINFRKMMDASNDSPLRSSCEVSPTHCTTLMSNPSSSSVEATNFWKKMVANNDSPPKSSCEVSPMHCPRLMSNPSSVEATSFRKKMIASNDPLPKSSCEVSLKKAIHGTKLMSNPSSVDATSSRKKMVASNDSPPKSSGEVSLKNAMHCTKLMSNPSSVEALNFRKKMVASNDSPPKTLSRNSATQRGLEVEFLNNITAKAIVELKDIREEITCAVLGTVEHVLETENWWYIACHCRTSVYPNPEKYYCKKCDKHVKNVTPRYKIKVRIMDDTDSAVFVIFDPEASLLFNKSCADMIKLAEKNSDTSSIPKEILNLEDKTFLFKVHQRKQFNSRFEQSYIVRSLCKDEGIIQKFKDKFFPTKKLTRKMSDGLNEFQADCALKLSQNFPYSTPASKEMETPADCGYLHIGTSSGNADKGSRAKGKQLFSGKEMMIEKVSDGGDESQTPYFNAVHLDLGLDGIDPGYLKDVDDEEVENVTLTPKMKGLSQRNNGKSKATYDYAGTKRSSEVDLESHKKSAPKFLKIKNVKLEKH